MKRLKQWIFLATLPILSCLGAQDFGYIDYTTYNIGDDIQAIAAKQFLPGKPIGIDREFIGVFEHPQPLPTIFNGWFMHTKEFMWYRPDIPAPEASWPPSLSIDPLVISFHISKGFLPYAFTEEAVQFLKAHAPIGARDYGTLAELQARDIPSYFSGCLTLTLKNDADYRNNIIYAVDLDKESYHYLRSRTKYRVVPLTHIITTRTMLNPERRAKYTQDILEKYKRAKAVVTTRLHAAMPCIALETPVLLITPKGDSRFDGLRELAHHCDRAEFLNGQFDFDLNEPPKNPDDYLELRENLNQVVSDWVKTYQGI